MARPKLSDEVVRLRAELAVAEANLSTWTKTAIGHVNTIVALEQQRDQLLATINS